MKNTLGISFVYIGLVIGAGFASGREIFEYFNLPSRNDFTGIIFAALGFAMVAYMIMDMANRLKVCSFDEFLDKVSGRAAPIIKIFMFSFMFSGFFVMLSASGVLFENTFSLPPKLGILFLAFVCFVIFVFDIKGLVSVNLFLVPLMLLGMVFLSLSSILCGNQPVFSFYDSVRHNLIVSAMCYVSYNTITVGAVLVPLSASAKKQDIIRCAIIAGAVLGVLIFLVWSALNIYYDVIFASEMPLLDLSARYGNFSKWVYSAILLMALCTTAISHGFGILSKFNLTRICDRILASALFCLAALPFARFGFSGLISNLYSVFGFLGLIWTIMLIYKYVRKT